MQSPFGPVQAGLVQDRSTAKERVVDLSTFRATKERTGTGLRTTPSPDSPNLTKHEDEALAIHKEPKKPRTLMGDARNVTGRVNNFLGLND
jgi:hypothetical protein